MPANQSRACQIDKALASFACSTHQTVSGWSAGEQSELRLLHEIFLFLSNIQFGIKSFSPFGFDVFLCVFRGFATIYIDPGHLALTVIRNSFTSGLPYSIPGLEQKRSTDMSKRGFNLEQPTSPPSPFSMQFG